MLCVLYFTCILFVFLTNVVTLCKCHSEIKGYLLTYLLIAMQASNRCTLRSDHIVWHAHVDRHLAAGALPDHLRRPPPHQDW